MRHVKTATATISVLFIIPLMLASASVTGHQIQVPRQVDPAALKAVEILPATPSPTPYMAISAPYVAAIYETRPLPRSTAQPATPKATQRPKAIAVTKKIKPATQRVAAKPKAPRLAHSARGLASWYCKSGRSICMAAHPDTRGFDAYAAAGPALRRAMCGSSKSNCWRNRIVSVNGIRVKLADWCKCTGGSVGNEKLIDLYWDVFKKTGGNVTIRW